jgi:predicted nuclease of restriction endonuclease-like (RecB) superfamily
MPEILSSPDYSQLLAEVKERIRSAQYAALKAVNTELVGLYWDLGRKIAERQDRAGWGKSVVERLSKDLRQEFPGIAGFSVQNLWYMRQFYMEYHRHEKLQPLVGEVAWAHNLVIMGKCKDALEREFYLRMTRKFGWSNEITKTLPKELKGQLPRPEEIAALLEGLEP